MGWELKVMKRLTNIEFIERARQLYNDKYDYSKVHYINTSTKVCIICTEHGEFWMTPNNFLNGHKCLACSGKERINKEVFVSRSKIIHKNRYDYSKVNYKGLQKKVCIICPIHGEFWQKPAYHLNFNGCQKCFATPKSSTEEFIRKAKYIYGDKYDYSKVDYNGNKTKVCIICHEHGEWWMSPNNHLRGHSCPGCYGTPKRTNVEFVQKSRIIHGDKYDYSKVDYTGIKNKVCIICPEHGQFWQSASSHLNGNGCSKCSNTESLTQDSFITRSTDIHKGKYDYSNVIYTSRKNKVCIICPEHGEFWQNPNYHLHGGNCPKCVGGVRLTTDEFIEKAKDVHEDKYDYSKVEYKNTSTKVCIVCPEHGEYWQTPNNHLFGAGCPACPQSNLEGEIRQLLIKNSIEFEQEKGFNWLVFKRKMYLDFFLPDYGVSIECQGRQHFFPSKLFGGEEYFRLTIESDRIKKSLCEKHGINILYFSNCNINYPYPVFQSLRLLLKAIKRYGIVELNQWEEQIELPFET
jgi:hypothetical protein